MKCPNKDCKSTLSNPYECKDCGWTSRNKPEEPNMVRQCFHCHYDIPEGKYYRTFRSREHGIESLRYKCAVCLLYADLDWREKHYRDWLEKHPEFKFKPQNEQDQKDMQEMSMAYLQKIMKGGITRKLPYDKNSWPEKLDYNEDELLAMLPQSDFADLEEPLEVGK